MLDCVTSETTRFWMSSSYGLSLCTLTLECAWILLKKQLNVFFSCTMRTHSPFVVLIGSTLEDPSWEFHDRTELWDKRLMAETKSFNNDKRKEQSSPTVRRIREISDCLWLSIEAWRRPWKKPDFFFFSTLTSQRSRQLGKILQWKEEGPAGWAPTISAFDRFLHRFFVYFDILFCKSSHQCRSDVLNGLVTKIAKSPITVRHFFIVGASANGGQSREHLQTHDYVLFRITFR